MFTFVSVKSQGHWALQLILKALPSPGCYKEINTGLALSTRKASKRACLWATAVVQVAGGLSQYHENIGCPAQNNRRLPPLAILTTGGTLGCLLQQFADLGDVISDLHQESFSRGWQTVFFQVVATLIKTCRCR